MLKIAKMWWPMPYWIGVLPPEILVKTQRTIENAPLGGVDCTKKHMGYPDQNLVILVKKTIT
jgi:hypothetical protein